MAEYNPLDDLDPQRLHPPTQWLRDNTTYDDDAGVYYEPFVKDGRVGYRVASIDGARETYIYFNPSTGSNDLEHKANVFIYIGEDNDPAIDPPECYVDLPFGARAEEAP